MGSNTSYNNSFALKTIVEEKLVDMMGELHFYKSLKTLMYTSPIYFMEMCLVLMRDRVTSKGQYLSDELNQKYKTTSSICILFDVFRVVFLLCNVVVFIV
jgi:hypothetical protein